MIVEKKYFSITEVAKFTGLPPHKLRYLEKSDAKLSIIKMRGRRYYTKDSIDYLTQSYSKDHSMESPKGKMDNIGSKKDLKGDDFVDKEMKYARSSFNPPNYPEEYKTTLPYQLDLGIKHSSHNSSTQKLDYENFRLESVNKITNNVALSNAHVFTEIEFHQISFISRIDRLLNKLYKLMDQSK